MGLEGVGQQTGGGGSLRQGLGAGDRRRPRGKKSGARTRPHKDCGVAELGPCSRNIGKTLSHGQRGKASSRATMFSTLGLTTARGSPRNQV